MNNDELLKENISIALKKIGNYIYEGGFSIYFFV
ncbi:unknown [Mycoplasma sp. CAG:611]|nr:unknown [Mycoplasma sp. CAG:611]